MICNRATILKKWRIEKNSQRVRTFEEEHLQCFWIVIVITAAAVLWGPFLLTACSKSLIRHKNLLRILSAGIICWSFLYLSVSVSFSL